jgi:hypothetical protein
LKTTSHGGSFRGDVADHAIDAHRSAEPHRSIVVLLVDDQPFVGAAVGRLLATEPGIDLHYCRN